MEVIKKDQIYTNTEFISKEELFEFISVQAFNLGITSNAERFLSGLYARELEASTCFGDEIAIPHCRDACINFASVLIIKNNKPILWDDNQQLASFILVLAVPDSKDNTHIKLLSQIARKFVDEEFVQKIKTMSTQEELFACFNDILMEER